MDIKGWNDKLLSLVKKYKYVLIVVLIGIAFMLIPSTKNETKTTSVVQPTSVQFEDPTKELCDILSHVRGAGKVRIFLTLEAGEKTVYQTDSDNTLNGDSQSLRYETVIVVDENRVEHGIITQIRAPEYRGAIVVCQGADDPNVKLAMMDAVKNATGLGYDRISVLKMK